MSTIPKSLVKSLKIGSMVRVTLPMFEGALAIGRVCDVQIVYIDNGIYTFVWVDMSLDGVKRQFTPDNLEVMPNVINGFDNALMFEIVSEAN